MSDLGFRLSSFVGFYEGFISFFNNKEAKRFRVSASGFPLSGFWPWRLRVGGQGYRIGA